MKKLKLILLFVTLSFIHENSFAQWNVTSWAATNGSNTMLQFFNSDTAYCYQYVFSTGYVLFQTKNQGQNWDTIAVQSNDSIVPFHFFDYKNGIAITLSNIYRTYDSGKTWHSTTYIDSIVNVYFYSAKEGFAYNRTNIYKSIDSGKIWKIVNNTYRTEHGSLTTSTMNFIDAAHGYLLGDASSYSLLYETTDSGNTWAYKMPGYGDIEVNNEIFITSSLAYTISDYTFYKSIDSGNTWVKMENGLPSGKLDIEGFAFTDSLTGYIILETNTSHDDFIYKTFDGGRLWQLQEDLGVSVLESYQAGTYFTFLNKDFGYIYNNVGGTDIAFTTNGGGITTGIKPTKETFNFKVYPNPSQSAFILSATLPNNNSAVLSIYDIAGKLVSSQVLQPTIQGILNQQISTTNLSAGYYMVSLEQNGNRVTGKLLKE